MCASCTVIDDKERQPVHLTADLKTCQEAKLLLLLLWYRM